MENGTNIDPRVIDRVQKLLNLSRDGGATEAEANTAMEMAERIMLENNLSMAMVEANNGKTATEQRLKEGVKKKAHKRWQRKLMETIAESCFCYYSLRTEPRRNKQGYAEHAVGFDLIGRVSNVASAKQMYEYLLHTIDRLRVEYSDDKKEQELFVAGLADRLTRRVRDRHIVQMMEQKAEAERKMREEASRARHPAAAPTTTSLVVVLEDYAAAERDYNNDFRYGLVPGSTARERAERREKHRIATELWEKLKAEGIESEVAYDMAFLGWTREKAEAYEARVKADAEANKGKESRYRYRRTRQDRLNDWDYERSHTSAYRDGERAGDSVSLAAQLGDKPNRKLGPSR